MVDVTCQLCKLAISPTPVVELAQECSLTVQKEYVEGALRHSSLLTFNMILAAEKLFRQCEATLLTPANVKTYMLGIMMGAMESHFQPHEHDTQKLALSKFLDLRLRIHCRRLEETAKDSSTSGRDSRSAAMRHYVKVLQ